MKRRSPPTWKTLPSFNLFLFEGIEYCIVGGESNECAQFKFSLLCTICLSALTALTLSISKKAVV